MTENPYQVFHSDVFSPVTFPGWGQSGLYRQGSLLIVHKSAKFPDRCIKSNEPTTRRLRRVLYWHLPVYYLLMIAGPLYVIVSSFVRRRIELQIPLSDRILSRRRTHLTIAISLMLAGVIAFVCGIVMIISMNPNTIVPAGYLMLAGPSLWLPASLWGILGCRVIAPRYIGDDFAKVSGVGHDFLASLPEWPSEQP